MTELLSVEELGEKIKFSNSTIYRWVKDRKFPYVKMPGNDIRFDKAKIESCIEARAVPKRS